MNVIEQFRKKLNCQIGYSDHSGSIAPPLMALTLNSNLIEVHVKLNNYEKGPDSTSSINFKQFRDLCRLRTEIFIINNNPVNKISSKRYNKMRNLLEKV